MSFLIDTNVLSELQKGERADSGVKAWFASVPAEELYLSVLVIGELQCGISRLQLRDPAQAAVLEFRMGRLREQMQDRILPVNEAVAARWGQLNSRDPLPVIDGLLAATALEFGMTLVTRNTKDVERSCVVLLNPFAR